jgi:hypothetical protein
MASSGVARAEICEVGWIDERDQEIWAKRLDEEWRVGVIGWCVWVGRPRWVSAAAMPVEMVWVTESCRYGGGGNGSMKRWSRGSSSEEVDRSAGMEGQMGKRRRWNCDRRGGSQPEIKHKNLKVDIYYVYLVWRLWEFTDISEYLRILDKDIKRDIRNIRNGYISGILRDIYG